ncbi:MAG: glycosyltransferase [Pseudomonadota bacterium]
MPSVLFSHTNFPAQFGAFGAWLAEEGWDVRFATARADASAPPGCRMFHFEAEVGVPDDMDSDGAPLEQALRNARGFEMSAEAARSEGYIPDLVVAHSGWGAGTYARAVWPETKFVAYVEWWYAHPSPDVTPEEPDLKSDVRLRARALSKNAPVLLDLAEADAILCPTRFQAAQFPPWMRERMTVIHDGVDTDLHAPNARARARLALYGLPQDAELVTYVARGMEPYRGFPAFMRTLATLQARRPGLHALIVGEDRVAYGRALPENDSWRKRMLAELDIDPARTHFTGELPRPDYITVLQASDAHVYLTIPFVLSWSFIEAMSVGCPMVASDVAPVREAAEGSAVVLVDHANTEALVTRVSAMLDDQVAARHVAGRSRDHANAKYSKAHLWPDRKRFLEDQIHLNC